MDKQCLVSEFTANLNITVVKSAQHTVRKVIATHNTFSAYSKFHYINLQTSLQLFTVCYPKTGCKGVFTITIIIRYIYPNAVSRN